MTATSTTVAELHRDGRWLATVGVDHDTDEPPLLEAPAVAVVVDVYDGGWMTSGEARDLAARLLEAASIADVMSPIGDAST